MRHNIFKTALLAIFVAAATPLMAQTTSVDSPAKSKREIRREQARMQPKVSSEFGLGVGARYNFFEAQPLTPGFTPNMTMKWSGGAALQFRLNIGRSFGFQPEISYARSELRISDASGNNLYDIKAKSNIVQIPMLLSFRAAMFRFNFGPVFTLMDNPTYLLSVPDSDNQLETHYIGKIYPTVTYAAGISVKFAKVMMLDVRYASQFKDIKSENEFLWTLDGNKQAEAWKFRTRTQSVQVRLGVVF